MQNSQDVINEAEGNTHQKWHTGIKSDIQDSIQLFYLIYIQFVFHNFSSWGFGVIGRLAHRNGSC